MAPAKGQEAEQHPLVSSSPEGPSAEDGPFVGEEEFLEYRRRPRRRKSARGSDHPLYYLQRYIPAGGRPKLILYIVGTILVLSAIALIRYRHRRYLPPIPPMDLSHSDNPYFFNGDVWKHNDEVFARLGRCAELGLLRNTTDPLPPLTADEESARIAQGCGTNQTTVIILSSIYMAEAFAGTAYATAGEGIYAQSVISTLNRWGYSYMFSSLGWYNHDMRKTMELYRRHRANVRMVLADPEQVEVCWHYPDQGCLKADDNQDGIPAWRLLGFWYWDDPGNPLGPAFTLSPSPRNNNHFISFSIEPTCRRLPFLPHTQRLPHQAYLLAKQVHYVEPAPEFSWTLEALADIQDELDIRVVGGMRDDDEKVTKAVEESGITNLGYLDKIGFYDQLARSFVLVGVGRPRISPSPWDALCMGVPFINPILTWDEEDPSNRTKWHAQQWHMTDLNPPYVYSVKAHDLNGLRKAIQAALDHPIESWIPDYMKFDSVCDRMAELLEIDWKAKAKDILDERIRSGEGEIFLL